MSFETWRRVIFFARRLVFINLFVFISYPPVVTNQHRLSSNVYRSRSQLMAAAAARSTVRMLSSIQYLLIVIFVGFMVATDNGGHVRSFSLNHYDFQSIHLRSNERYDALFGLFQLQKHLRSLLPPNKRQRSAITDRRSEKGIQGECLFRQLAFFDVGRSFLVDTLHKVYLGAFASGAKIFSTSILLSLNLRNV